ALVRACASACGPWQAARRDYETKARTHNSVNARPGWRFLSVDVTEVSICGVGSNPAAILEMAYDKECPAGLCKSLRATLNGHRPRALSPAVAARWGRLESKLVGFIEKQVQADSEASGGPRVPVNEPQCTNCEECREVGKCPHRKSCLCVKRMREERRQLASI